MSYRRLPGLLMSQKQDRFFTLRTYIEHSLDTSLMKDPLRALLGQTTQFPLTKRNDLCLTYSIVLQQYLYQHEISSTCVKARHTTDDDAIDHCFLIRLEDQAGKMTIIDPTAGQFFSSDSLPRPFNTLIFQMTTDLSQCDFSQYCDHSSNGTSLLAPNQYPLVEHLDLPLETGVSIQDEYKAMLSRSRIMPSKEIVASLHRCLTAKNTAEILGSLSGLHKNPDQVDTEIKYTIK